MNEIQIKQMIYRYINKYKLIVAAALVMICCILSGRETMAEITDPVYEKTVNDYDVTYHYGVKRYYVGIARLSARGDFTGIEKIKVPYKLVYEKCCDNPGISSYNYVRISLDGNELYTGREKEICDSSFSISGYDEPVIDITGKGTVNSIIQIEIMDISIICDNCHNQPNTRCMIDGLYLYDFRPKAYMAESVINVPASGNVTVLPTYNERVSRVEWAVRFSGESEFTRLDEGGNTRGITASAVNSQSVTLSNIPYIEGGFDLGVFAYDAYGSLPGGTTFPNTPFFTHVNVTDNIGPTVTVTKSYDTATGTVIATASGADVGGGLSDTPYSWDNGATYTAANYRSHTQPGTFKVYVRDRAGNTGVADYYIDSLDIKKVKPASNEPSEPAPTPKPSSSSSSGRVTPPGDTPGGSTPSPGSSSARPDPDSPGTKQFEGKNDDTDDYVKPSVVTPVKPKEPGSSGGSNTPSGDDKKKAGKPDSSLPGDVTEGDESVFEKIKNNSKEYVISMKEWGSKKEKEKAEKAQLNLEEKETEPSTAESYTDSGAIENESYKPKPFIKSKGFIILMAVLLVVLILLLLFVLFFGVIIFTEKETEYSELSNSDGIKIPVALSFVTYRDGIFSICFRELLDKYDVLYARPGVLFVYMFENEKISIRTKFKGEESHEIAKETIKSEITVGQKKGGRK